MKILCYGTRKMDATSWPIDTPEQRASAFLVLFRLLRDEGQVYTTGYWGDTRPEQAEQKRLYALANDGDSKAAEKLLTMRRDYEYEEWSTEIVAAAQPKPRAEGGR